MKTGKGKTIREQLADGAMLEALRIGSRRAVRMHKLLGNPVATVRNGKVVLIPPDEIQLDDDAAAMNQFPPGLPQPD